jgi:hypothetical protein
MDPNSDYHIQCAANEAQRLGGLVVNAILNGRTELAWMVARRAAHAGLTALAKIERRGTDDLEFFVN